MRRVCLVALLLCFCVSQVCAHPGNLDSNGGHWNRSTGEYHYHDGNSKSGGGGSSGYSANTPLPWQKWESKSTAAPKVKKDTREEINNRNRITFIVIIALALSFGIWFAAMAIKKHKAHKEYMLMERIRKANEREKQQIEDDRLRKMYASHSLRELSGMPDDTVIGEDGLPKVTGSDGWGDYYTRYTYGSGGNCYHRASCQYGATPAHVVKLSKKSACGVCKPDPLPDTKWYDSYVKHCSECKRLNCKPLPSPSVSREAPL